MMRVPVAPSALGQVVNWAREITDYVASLEPNQTPDALLTRTTRGTTLTPTAEDGGGDGATSKFKGQWVDTSYDAEDQVICESATTLVGDSNELDDGRFAGTFSAKEAISPGDLHPGIEPQTALAHATLSGGGVASIVRDDAGYGYSTPPAVTLTGGGGSGATAHSEITGASVSLIVVDTAGSGYTSAPTVTIADPTLTQKWEDMARVLTKHVLRPVAQARNKQRIIIDAGRDGGQKPIIQMRIKQTDGTVGSITLDLNDIPGGAGDKVLKIREWEICVEGVNKNILLVSSDAYTP